MVDDEPAVRSLLETWLGHLGVDVEVASSLAEARDALAAGAFALVVTDVHLGSGRDADGLLLLEHVRRHDPEIPVVVITGRPTPEIEEQTRRHGAEGLLTKPLALETLAAVVRHALGAEGD